jgi:hypothetical protein
MEGVSKGRYAKRPCEAPCLHLLKDLVKHFAASYKVSRTAFKNTSSLQIQIDQ